MDAAELADQAAEDDDRERGEQPVCEPVLALGLASRDHRREEDPGGEERGRDEEDRQLHVEGAGEVEWKELGQVDPEEAAGLDHVAMYGRASDQVLEQEQRGDDQEEPGGHPRWAGVRGTSPGLAERERRLLAPVPAEEVPAPERREQQADARRAARSARRRSKARRWRSARCRPAPRAASCSCRSSCGPGRRADAAQADQLKNAVSSWTCSGVVDRIGAQPQLGGRVAEVVGVVALELLERARLRVRVGECVGVRVVAVRLEVGDRLLARAVRAGAAVVVLDRERGAVQVVGRVVGPEVGAVAEDRAVLHQPVVEEDLLARG